MQDTVASGGRRCFLISSAATGSALLLGFDLAAARQEAPGIVFRPNAFLRIDTAGEITVLVPNTEIGQGSLTALAAVVAEELDAEWGRVRAEQAPTHPDYAHPWFQVQMTGASSGTPARWEQLRRAGATARAMLVAAAAAQWQVPAGSCMTEQGRVTGPGGRSAAYRDLTRSAAGLVPPPQVALKDPAQFRLIGRGLPRLDTPAKVDGSAVYGMDVQLPGLLTAVVERPPVIGGKLARFDASRALAVSGVRHVAPVAGGLAVIADGFWSAQQGRAALEVEWDNGKLEALDTEQLAQTHRLLAHEAGIEAARVGDVSVVHGRTVEATYEVPYLAHACMEPMTCTAWVHADGVQLWVPTQAQGINQIVVSRVLGIAPDQVKVVTTYAGGGFGRRAAQDFVIDAVLASKAAGAPVKLIYSREDDTRSLHYRPAALGRMSATLGARGEPLALSGRVVCSSAYGGAGYDVLFKGPLDPGSVEGLADTFYAIPNLKVDWVRHEPGVQVFTWRSVGQSFVVFFTESFVDEMAHAAGADPLQYRLALLSERPRHRRVLEIAARKAGWGSALPAGHGRGIALCEDRGHPLALVVEVRLEGGLVRVQRMTCAVDCGIAINPALVRAQIESGLVFGLSATLTGRIDIRAGRVQQGNFDDYPVLRMRDCPPMDVHVEQSGGAPAGIGEISVPVVAPAVCNAVHAAGGGRARRLPLDGQG